MTECTRCSTPRCSRQAPLEARGVNIWWSGDDSAPSCVPCYLAFAEGSGRSRNEVTFEVADHSLLSDADRDALVKG